MPLYIKRSGDLLKCHGCLTDRQALKDRATQLLIKFKTGALVTQFELTKDHVLTSAYVYIFRTVNREMP